MMSRLNFGPLAALGFGFLALSGAPASSATPEADAGPTTYTWSAELVALDEGSHTITVKAPLVSTPEHTDLSALHPGDRAMLTWSGISTAAGIRALERGTRSSFDRMTMPVEYVGSELEGRYVTFKVPVPEQEVSKIAKLEPGQYVTATSPLVAREPGEVVRSIRAYTDIG